MHLFTSKPYVAKYPKKKGWYEWENGKIQIRNNFKKKQKKKKKNKQYVTQ